MTRFQLTFRREGRADESEFRCNDADGEPHIDGKLIVDGETYVSAVSSGFYAATTQTTR